MVTLRELAATFFRIGLTAYGGPAIVAQIRDEVVRRRGWVTAGAFDDSLALAQIVPGAIAVHTATHVGWRLAGGRGAVVALVAYVTPAVLLMAGLSAFYVHLGRLPLVEVGLRGMRAATVGIVVGSIAGLGAAALRDWRGALLAAAAAAAFLARLNAVAVLVCAGALAVLLLPREPAGDAAPVAAPSGPQRRTLLAAGVVAVGFALVVLALGRLGPVYPRLTLALVKVNLLAFGGGYTAVALLYEQVVVANGWLTPAAFVDGLALGQVTPGPVIVTGTFVGYAAAGPLGAALATLCMFVPSGLLLVIAAPHFDRLRRSRVARRLVRGLLAAFVGMLFFVLWQVASAAIVDPLTLALTLGSILALRLRVSPALLVAGAVAVSLAVALAAPLVSGR
ncbi:MAG TPA: chromate efflux transporter [Polyangia bacterium]